MTGTSQPAHVVAYLSSTASTPGFWRPIELSIPAGVSVTRGGGLPRRGLSVVPLQQIAPSAWTSTTSPYSRPYPNVPDATSTGLSSTSAPSRRGARSTARSTRRPDGASSTGGGGGGGAIAGPRGARWNVSPGRRRAELGMMRGLGGDALGERAAAARVVITERFRFTAPPSRRSR